RWPDVSGMSGRMAWNPQRVRKNALIARKQGVWQGYLTCEKAEKRREISDRIGAKGSAKKGQKRRELTHGPTQDPL
ncbi:hypothetical protein, partial [Pseudomonas brassicacearum]|uniref:hypothetical protein n=1 Tax=Pseudomonas brassicacearum TaxID=930166 RepID=UPI001C828595